MKRSKHNSVLFITGFVVVFRLVCHLQPRGLLLLQGGHNSSVLLFYQRKP